MGKINGGSIQLPAPLLSLPTLSLIKSEQRPILNQWQCVLSWKRVGFLRQAGTRRSRHEEGCGRLRPLAHPSSPTEYQEESPAGEA